MRINEKTIITGDKVVLVPYRAQHVEKYHQWMQSKELQELTASEPLTLEQEYEMQKSWRKDDDKLTFIILSKKLYSLSNGDEIESMVGDVNIFLNDPERKNIAEIEIMIADPSARAQGLGKEALLIMMNYGAEYLHLSKIIAKIGYNNYKSLALFSKIGFLEVSRSDVFEEISLELLLDETVKKWLREKNSIVMTVDDKS